MKRLYVTDLDGTLLDRKSAVSLKSKTILNQFIRSGGYITYATARSYTSARIVTQGIDFSLPVVVYNGTFIYDIKNCSFLHSEYFSKENIEQLFSLCRMFSLTPLVYTFVDGVEKILWNKNGVLSDGFLYYLNRRREDKRMCAVNTLEQSFQGNIFYLTFIENQEDLQEVYACIQQLGCFNCVFQQEIYRTEYWCEIMPKSVNKASAIVRLKEFLQCDELVVFGDSLNDIPMFRTAQRSYAVGNANDNLKQIATEVIGYNDGDSVALKLAELENIRSV